MQTDPQDQAWPIRSRHDQTDEEKHPHGAVVV